MMVEVNVSMASVTVRVDADTKQKAANIAEDLGLDLSSVTRAFYKQIVREKRIPLNLSQRIEHLIGTVEARLAVGEPVLRLVKGLHGFRRHDRIGKV